MPERAWRVSIAAALGAGALFAIAAFGAVERWSMTVLQVWMFLLAALWIVRLRATPFRWSVTWAPLLFAGATAWGGAQIVWRRTVYPAASQAWLLNWLAYSLAALLAVQVFQGHALRRAFLRVGAAGGFAFAVFGVAQRLLFPEQVYGIPAAEGALPFASFFNRNHYAALAELVLPMALYLALSSSRNRAQWSVAAGTIVASVLLASSRAGAALALFEVVFVILWQSARREPSRVPLPRLVAPVLLAIFSLTLLVGGESVAGRFLDPEPLRHRDQIAASGWSMWRERPWTGFGVGTFEIVYPEYATVDTGRRVDHAHNDWVQWLAEAGLPLVLLALSLFARSLAAALRQPWGIGVPAVLVHSLVDFPMQIPAIAVSVALISGVLSVRDNDRGAGGRCLRQATTMRLSQPHAGSGWGEPRA